MMGQLYSVGRNIEAKVMKVVSKALIVSLMGASLLAGAAHAATTDKKIALSNNYAGNSWRQAMLKSFESVGKKAVADKVVAKVDVFTTADRAVPTQAAQIQNLILQRYNAIVLNASSPSALNGAVRQACSAGIIVVSFDSIVTEPCAWRITVDYNAMGRQQVAELARLQPKGGNLLEIRGLAGTSTDAKIHGGITEGLKNYPQFKVVRSVTGDWDQTTAQKNISAVLPSLPPIVGVVSQGGDGYGAAQAFAAARKPRPTIMLGNRQDELAWWQQQKQDGYRTWSASISPGISSFAFWVAQQILDGKPVPKDITIPYLAFTQENFEAELKAIPKGGVASKDYTQAGAIAIITKK